MQKKLFIITSIIIFLALVVILVSQKGTITTSTKDGSTTVPTRDAFSVSTHDGTYDIDPASNSVSWEGRGIGKKHMGIVPVSGSISFFNDAMDATLSFDMNNLRSTDPDGVNEQLDTHLRSADFFDVQLYPTATLHIDTIEEKTPTATDVSNGIVRGTLTMKDIKAPVIIPVEFVDVSDTQMRIRGEMSIDRTVWGVNFNSSSLVKNLGDAAIADEVMIRFNILAQK